MIMTMDKIKADIRTTRRNREVFQSRLNTYKTMLKRAMERDQWDKADRLAEALEVCIRGVHVMGIKLRELREGIREHVR